MKYNLAFLLLLLGFFSILLVNTNNKGSIYVIGVEERKKQGTFLDEGNSPTEMESVNLRIDSAHIFSLKGNETCILQREVKYNLQVNLSNLSGSIGTPFIVATFYDENFVPVSTNSSIITIMPFSQHLLRLSFTIEGYSYTGIGTFRLDLLTKSVDEGGVSIGSEYVKTIMITK